MKRNFLSLANLCRLTPKFLIVDQSDAIVLFSFSFFPFYLFIMLKSRVFLFYPSKSSNSLDKWESCAFMMTTWIETVHWWPRCTNLKMLKTLAKKINIEIPFDKFNRPLPLQFTHSKCSYCLPWGMCIQILLSYFQVTSILLILCISSSSFFFLLLIIEVKMLNLRKWRCYIFI